MLSEAIILAGGLGTRLQDVVKDLPKSMAPVNGRPFLGYLLDHFIDQGISKFIISTGHLADHITRHFQSQYRGCDITYSYEDRPLGTGGAIKKSLQLVQGKDVLVANGDSLFLGNIRDQYQLHLRTSADVTLALKPMSNFARYGTVKIDQHNRIAGFKEKKPVQSGLINAGRYIFDKNCLTKVSTAERFSIENDFFGRYVEHLKFMGYQSDAYFLDIGIPEDFDRAQHEFKSLLLTKPEWTLFLDRDGVINKRKVGGYVQSVSEFEFIEGSLEAIVSLSKIFGKIIVVTNQQGIGKGVMSEEDLHSIHTYMKKAIEKAGGRIDAIYHAPDLESAKSPLRKPGTGMATRAKNDFPEIDLNKSIMIGDSDTDIIFAKKANMKAIFITGGLNNDNKLADYCLPNLVDLSDGNILSQIFEMAV